MGTESLLLIFLAVIYGYHAMVLLFGTSHCLGIALGEFDSSRGMQEPVLLACPEQVVMLVWHASVSHSISRQIGW